MFQRVATVKARPDMLIATCSLLLLLPRLGRKAPSVAPELVAPAGRRRGGCA